MYISSTAHDGSKGSLSVDEIDCNIWLVYVKVAQFIKKLLVFVVIHEIWKRTESQQKQHVVNTFIISYGLSHFDLKMFHQAWNGSMLKGINIIQELLIAQQQEDELSCFHPIEVWKAIDLSFA